MLTYFGLWWFLWKVFPSALYFIRTYYRWINMFGILCVFNFAGLLTFYFIAEEKSYYE